MSRTILLVDYEPRSIERIRRALSASGYFVRVATDGVAGIHAFEVSAPDLVVVQDLLPRKHGFELCRDIKSSLLGETTPVILLTGRGARKGHELRATRCDDHLEKPFADQALVGKVAALLPGEPRPAAAPVKRAAPAATVPPNGRRPAPASPTPVVIPTRFTEGELSSRLDDLFGAFDAAPAETAAEAAALPAAEAAPGNGNGHGDLAAAAPEPDDAGEPAAARPKRARKKSGRRRSGRSRKTSAKRDGGAPKRSTKRAPKRAGKSAARAAAD